MTGAARQTQYITPLARGGRGSIRQRQTYCEGAPSVGLGHIESNDGAFCDAG